MPNRFCVTSFVYLHVSVSSFVYNGSFLYLAFKTHHEHVEYPQHSCQGSHRNWVGRERNKRRTRRLVLSDIPHKHFLQYPATACHRALCSSCSCHKCAYHCRMLYRSMRDPNRISRWQLAFIFAFQHALHGYGFRPHIPATTQTHKHKNRMCAHTHTCFYIFTFILILFYIFIWDLYIAWRQWYSVLLQILSPSFV